jgi:hypothetical protein
MLAVITGTSCRLLSDRIGRYDLIARDILSLLSKTTKI